MPAKNRWLPRRECAEFQHQLEGRTCVLRPDPQVSSIAMPKFSLSYSFLRVQMFVAHQTPSGAAGLLEAEPREPDGEPEPGVRRGGAAPGHPADARPRGHGARGEARRALGYGLRVLLLPRVRRPAESRDGRQPHLQGTLFYSIIKMILVRVHEYSSSSSTLSLAL